MHAQRFTDPFLRGNVPEYDCRIAAAGGQQLTIRAEGNRLYVVGVPDQGLAYVLMGGDVPQHDRFIVTARRQQLTVRAKGDAPHSRRMPLQRLPDSLMRG